MEYTLRKEASKPQNKEDRDRELLNKKILVVESYPDLTRTFALILQGNGYITESARTTDEAVEKIQNDRYDAVLIDDEPPLVEAQAILQSVVEQRIAKIVITDYSERASHNGADACINKIVKPRELLLLTRKLLKKKQRKGILNLR
jgi:DNA-binding response OmpR family regulator